ncbi:MAG: TIGR04282 family arsenosugar biosynthesis glycosyltransferase [Thermodesulfobacteriota bacterium]
MNHGPEVLVFIRYPVPGRVKTRLAVHLGGEAAASLYRCFVEDTLATLSTLGWPIRLCYTPEEQVGNFLSWLGSGYVYQPQRGSDLGERMKDAFQQAFAHGCDAACLIGSDVPDLPLAVFREAQREMSFRDAVIGPALDGGYYLIGLHRESFSPEIFAGLAWGTSGVFSETNRLFKKKGLRVHVLPSWRDVDTLDDLRDLNRRNPGQVFSRSLTFRLLTRLDLAWPVHSSPTPSIEVKKT